LVLNNKEFIYKHNKTQEVLYCQWKHLQTGDTTTKS
jgi:hypothetical protein